MLWYLPGPDSDDRPVMIYKKSGRTGLNWWRRQDDRQKETNAKMTDNDGHEKVPAKMREGRVKDE
jgi:hypothetical protein